MAETKAAQSFRLGAKHRERLAALAEYQDESQTEIMRKLIDVAHRAMKKRLKDREERLARMAS